MPLSLLFFNPTPSPISIPSTLIIVIFSFLFFGCDACGILVPWPGMKPTPPALEVQSLNHWSARQVPRVVILRALSVAYTLEWMDDHCDLVPLVFSHLGSYWVHAKKSRYHYAHFTAEKHKTQGSVVTGPTMPWLALQPALLWGGPLPLPQPLSFRTFLQVHFLKIN